MWTWLCSLLPWHRWLSSSFWVSERVEIKMCSCGRQYAVNHSMQAVIPYDVETKAFYEARKGQPF